MTWFRLEIPLAGFRPYEARDFQESLLLPPHSTVFGCLLSILGVEGDGVTAYVGTMLSVAGVSADRSTIVRKMRRDPANVRRGVERVPTFRPEYQELLSDVQLWIWVSQGTAERDLAADLVSSLANPGQLSRQGIVSLGESCFMLDRIDLRNDPPDDLTVLRPKPDGAFLFTVWVDFADRTRTRTMRFDELNGRPNPGDAVRIGP